MKSAPAMDLFRHAAIMLPGYGSVTERCGEKYTMPHCRHATYVELSRTSRHGSLCVTDPRVWLLMTIDWKLLNQIAERLKEHGCILAENPAGKIIFRACTFKKYSIAFAQRSTYDGVHRFRY